MQFSVNSTDLRNALTAAAKVVPTKTAMPILENVRLRIPGSCNLDVTACDGDTTITQRIPIQTLDTQSETTICLNAKTLLEPLTTIPSQTLDITIEDLEVTVKYTTGKFNFVGVAAIEFPERKPIDPETKNVVNIASQSVIDAVSRNFYAMNNDELRPVTNGIFFDLADNNTLKCVASDSKKLNLTTHEGAWKGNPETRSFIMPRKMASLLKSVLNKECGDCEFRWDKNQLAVRFGSTLLCLKLIEGKFPPYEKVIPNNNNLEAVIDGKSFLFVLRRMLSFSNASTGQVVLNFDNDKCTISARDIDFNRSANEVTACAYPITYPPIRISFSAHRLIEVLSNLPLGDIRFTMSAPNRPALIYPASSDEDILTLLMPMAITD